MRPWGIFAFGDSWFRGLPVPNSIETPWMPGQYELSGGESVFISTPPGAVDFYVIDPNKDLFVAKVKDFGVPSAAGIYFVQEPLVSVTKLVIHPGDDPSAGRLSGVHTVGVSYGLPYLLPMWSFDIDRLDGGEG